MHFLSCGGEFNHHAKFMCDSLYKLLGENYMVINENGHQEVLSQYLTAMSRHFYSYLELMQDIGHDILIEEELL